MGVMLYHLLHILSVRSKSQVSPTLREDDTSELVSEDHLRILPATKEDGQVNHSDLTLSHENLN